jgi:hypothetical protein
VIIPVADDIAKREFSEIASRQEPLQTIFLSRLDIFYHPIFDFLKKNRLFQQPPLLSAVPIFSRMSRIMPRNVAGSMKARYKPVCRFIEPREPAIRLILRW